ncbi:unnamed protein product [Penicillium salamii]|nr:unnamed protein product [Penicillium salamii]CAG8380622.1 unnamed protein product [Penicillium salamii]
MFSSFSTFEPQDDGKAFVCSRCTRRFKRADHLQRHARTHTKEKPFTCRCGSSFSRKDLLKRHLIIAHSRQEENHTIQDAENHLPSPGHRIRTSLSPKNTRPMSQSENQRSSHLTQNLPDEIIDTSGFTDPLNDTGASGELFNDSLLHLQEITNFMDSAGLLTTYLNFDSDEINHLSEEQISELHNRSDSEEDDYHPGTPFRSWLPSAPLGNSSLATVKDFHSPHTPLSLSPFFNISRTRHSHIISLLSRCREKIPDFILPSRHALTRYLTSFWETFHPQMPFIHLPTTSFEEFSLEEILGYSSMGAQYRFEQKACFLPVKH